MMEGDFSSFKAETEAKESVGAAEAEKKRLAEENANATVSCLGFESVRHVHVKHLG